MYSRNRATSYVYVPMTKKAELTNLATQSLFLALSIRLLAWPTTRRQSLCASKLTLAQKSTPGIEVNPFYVCMSRLKSLLIFTTDYSFGELLANCADFVIEATSLGYLTLILDHCVLLISFSPCPQILAVMQWQCTADCIMHWPM